MDSCHWQYDELQKGKLFQGDILKRTKPVQKVLRTLYPYAYQHPERYPYFVVLTQSCDLVSDDERERKAEHITLAAVRPLRLFLEQEVAKLQTPLLKEVGVCLTKDKERFFNKVERLLSNEEYPYFYFHPSEETPFTEPLVAYLRITFPLRTDCHYKACLAAKRVQLAPVFQAKLGWLTTLVFGRVATSDFKREERHEFAREYIDSIVNVEWRKGKALANEARQQGLAESFMGLSSDKVRELIEAVDRKSHPEAIADMIANVAREIWPEKDDLLKKFRNRLLANTDFKASFSE